MTSFPAILSAEEPPKALRKSWVRLIQRIYEVDPLICPQCRGTMKIISFIEDPEIIRKILLHLNLWRIPARADYRTDLPRPGLFL